MYEVRFKEDQHLLCMPPYVLKVLLFERRIQIQR